MMAIAILISGFGCNNGLILSGARIYYAMAKDRLFFKSCGKVNRHHAPGAALIVQGIWASVLCLSGTYSQLLDFLIFAVLIFYILTLGGLFVLRWKRPGYGAPLSRHRISISSRALSGHGNISRNSTFAL